MIRILLVEDEVDMAQALAKGLRREGYAVDIAEDGAAGWEMAEANRYNLVLLDLNLPVMDGVEVCKRLRQSQPRLSIIMLTARHGSHNIINGLDVGADDYIGKPFHYHELLARIRVQLRRETPLKVSRLAYRDLLLDSAARTVMQAGRYLPLTRKEFAILEYMLLNAEATISAETLLEHIWDAHADPFTTTVRVHINSLRRKLATGRLADHTEPYIITVQGEGYRLHSGAHVEAVCFE
ncbi:response regulator transcription factor [Paenibacillus sp. KR2-11]|uniref:response regulator transcription factor n=1 Tax=Paenibacillus sp. KR2-11 TaxID=3385500 RepID=UPI0038FD3618